MGGGHGLHVGDTDLLPDALVVAEEEDAVLEDGTADGAAELVLEAAGEGVIGVSWLGPG